MCWVELVKNDTEQTDANSLNPFAAISRVKSADQPSEEYQICQFVPDRWKIFQYNMAGLLTTITSFDK